MKSMFGNLLIDILYLDDERRVYFSVFLLFLFFYLLIVMKILMLWCVDFKDCNEFVLGFELMFIVDFLI